MFFYRLFVCLKVNFRPLSTFAPWKGWRGTWKIYFSVKNLFWTILGLKMMASLNSGCKISIQASAHLCNFVSSSQGYQKYSRRLFYNYLKASWKNVVLLKPYCMALRLHPLIISSSSRDYISSSCYAFT